MSKPIVANGHRSTQAASNTPRIAAIYARVSTEDQGKGYSIPTQIEACQRLAQHEGYLVPQDYLIKDEGSGTTLERPGLCLLRKLVRTNIVAAIIVYDPDRLSRNLGHQLLLAEEAEKAGIKLLIVSHPLEQGPEGWLFFQMRGALAEYERAKILERMKRGAVGRIQAGHPWGGSVPLGYRYIPAPHGGHWEIDAEEAALVRRIFQLCVEGMPTRRIALILTSEHSPTPADRDPKRSGLANRLGKGVWCHQSIRKILTNTAYRGDAAWGKRQSVTKTTRRPRPQSDWLTFSVPPIVDAGLFAAAQVALTQHKACASRNRKHAYLFIEGRLRCGRCGRVMIGTYKAKGNARYYICTSARNVTDPALRCRGTLRAEMVEGEVWERVQRALERPGIIAQEVARQEASAEEQRAELQQEVTCLDAALAKCDRESARWDEAYAHEVINLEELKLYRADIATRRQQLITERAQRQVQIDLIGQAAGQATQLMAYCAQVSHQLQTFDLADKRLALTVLNIRVRWTPGEDFDVQGSIDLDGLWLPHL
jgi:site-specific DNA recombinase